MPGCPSIPARSEDSSCLPFTKVNASCRQAVRLIVGLITGLVILCLGGAFPLATPAQAQEGPVPELRQPSPTAASLGTFAEVPVGLYAGKPQVSVPLHEATGIDMTLPISLDYQGGGVKVDEIPGWAGMGWTLQAGGAITRVVRGAPDEQGSGYINTGEDLDEYWEIAEGTARGGTVYDLWQENDVPPSFSDFDFYMRADLLTTPQGRDAQPDEFFFNFAGQSGQFMMDTDGQARPIPYNNTHIEMVGPGIEGVSWKITTEDGTIYTFEEEETSRSTLGWVTWVSTWYLTKVESPNGETVHLSYVPVGTGFIGHERQRSYTEYYGRDGFCDLPRGVQQGYQITRTKTKRLTEIETEQERIEFDASPRTGFMEEEEYKIDGITVRDRATGALKKHVNLTYEARSIFENRLLLTGVSTQRGNAEPEHYAFEYAEAQGLPGRLSPNIDFWGYYNGADNNNTIPEIERVSNWGNMGLYEGANRDPNPATMEAGVLESIHYPTGGMATFDYEPHTFSKVAIPGGGYGSSVGEYDEISRSVGPTDISITSDGPPERTTSLQPFSVVNDRQDRDTVGVAITYKYGAVGTPSDEQTDCGFDPCVEINLRDVTDPTNSYIIDQHIPDEIPPVSWPGAPPYDGIGSESTFIYTAEEGRTYDVELVVRRPSISGAEVGVRAEATWTESVEPDPGDTPELIAGGVRVQQVTMQPEIGAPDVTTYDYNQSGVLQRSIRNYYRVRSGQCFYHTHESNPVSGLGTTQGNSVGYGQVTVINGPSRAEADGWTDHHFSTVSSEIGESGHIYSEVSKLAPRFGQHTNIDYLAGYEEQTEVYRRPEAGSGQLVERTTREYEKKLNWDASPDRISTRSRALFTQNNIPDRSGHNSIYFHTYYVEAPWIYLREETQETFDPEDGEAGPSRVVTTTYEWEDDPASAALKQRRSEQVTTSAGTGRTTTYEYAHEAHKPQMGPGGTHQLSEIYRTTVTNAAAEVLRRSWTTWQENPDPNGLGWVPFEEWVWTGTE